MTERKAIGIFGGTFDPIHHGHLRAAIEVYQHFNLDEMRMIPCKSPPHRSSPHASEAHRLKMIELACFDTKLRVDDQEMRRQGPSYSIDTLKLLRQENPEVSLCMILGIDALLGLPSWHRWDKILGLTNIIVMCRAGKSLPTEGVIADLLQQSRLTQHEPLTHHKAGKIIQSSITRLDISASTIRTLIKKGCLPHFLLPESVLGYIKQHALYDYREEK